MRGYIDPEGLVMLSFMILCLFVLVSCQESLEEPLSSSLAVDDVRPITPQVEPESSVEDEPQDTADTTKTQSLDDLLAQLEEEPEEVEIETSSDNESELVDSEIPSLPTTRKQACREAQLPATYEACLGGCTKQCGDISRVNCEDVQLPGADGQTFNCMTCSCTG